MGATIDLPPPVAIPLSCADVFAQQKANTIKSHEFLDPPGDGPIDGAKGLLISFKFKEASYQTFVSYWGTTTDIRSASVIHQRFSNGEAWTAWIQASARAGGKP